MLSMKGKIQKSQKKPLEELKKERKRLEISNAKEIELIFSRSKRYRSMREEKDRTQKLRLIFKVWGKKLSVSCFLYF